MAGLFKKKPPNTFDSITITKLFKDWSKSNAPEKVSCITALLKPFNDPVSLAIRLFANAKQNYAWDKTRDNITTALDSGLPLKINLDISIPQRLTSFTVLYTDINVPKIVNSTTHFIKIEAEFNKIIIFYSFPYSKVDNTNPILRQYNPWYYPEVMSYAYNTQDNTVWSDNSRITWGKAFGQDGFMRRVCVALVVVKGVNTKISYHYIDGGQDSDLQQFTKLTNHKGSILLGVIIRDINHFIKSSISIQEKN